MVNVIKVSQFTDGGDQVSGDLLTGLRNGGNENFTPNTDVVYTPLPYAVVTGLSMQMVGNNGYIANNAGQITFLLPSRFNDGDVIEVGNFNGGFIITQNITQQIIFGNKITTNGMGGSIASTALGDSIRLVGVAANTSFMVIPAPQGNLIVI